MYLEASNKQTCAGLAIYGRQQIAGAMSPGLPGMSFFQPDTTVTYDSMRLRSSDMIDRHNKMGVYDV